MLAGSPSVTTSVPLASALFNKAFSLSISVERVSFSPLASGNQNNNMNIQEIALKLLTYNQKNSILSKYYDNLTK